MTNPSSTSTAIASNLLQSALAGVVGALLSTAIMVLGWSYWPFWAVIALVILALIFATNALRLYVQRRRVERASGRKISILVAKLEGDEAHNGHRETVCEELKKQLGNSIEIARWPEALTVPAGGDEEAQIAVHAKAQGWLKEKNYEVLIWGRVKQGRALALRFTPRDDPGGSNSDTALDSEADVNTYGLTEKTLELPIEFISDVGAIIAARAMLSASAAVERAGTYIVPRMRAAADKLAPLMEHLDKAAWGDAGASLLFSYGMVRNAIGQQAGTKDDLQASVVAYRAALHRWTRERMPLAWATAQNNLGIALKVLGQQEANTAGLEEAIKAYRAALQEFTRERFPLNWAAIQNNLGNALTKLGEREGTTVRLEEAVEAYRAALEERTRERVPLNWATTQNNLGNALIRIGERSRRVESFIEAAAAYRAALQELPRERVPLDWAVTQNNLGSALARLGEREGTTARLEEAAEAYRAALEELPRDRLPLRWARAQNNLGNALSMLGERGQGTLRFVEAVEAYRKALVVFEDAGAEHYVEIAQRNRAKTEALLAIEKEERVCE